MWENVMRLRAEAQAHRAIFALPGWPVYAPVDQRDGITLGDFGQTNGETTIVEILSGIAAGPMGFGGAEISVRNQLTGVDGVGSLDVALAEQFSRTGREYPIPGDLHGPTFDGTLPAAPLAQRVSVQVDGVPRRAVKQRVEEFTGWQMLLGSVVVTAILRGPAEAELALVRLVDMGKLVARHPVGPPIPPERNWQNPLDWAVPPKESGPLWAHRGLVSMTLASATRHQVSLTSHRPLAGLDPDWRLWWSAAEDEQVSRSEEAPATARDAVSSMVNQVCDLAGSAKWWADERLRRRATEQVIWRTAAGDDSLSSAAAQRAYTNGEDWLAAWQAWADEQDHS